MNQTQNLPSKSVYFYGPKSFLTLILAGFFFVALPLVSALIYAGIYVEQLSEQSQRTIYEAAQTTQYTRTLIEQLTTMERTARQFQVLGDQSLVQSYADKHREFLDTTDQLRQLLAEDALSLQLNELIEDEKSLYQALWGKPSSMQMDAETLDKFVILTEAAQSLMTSSSQYIDQKITTMHQDAEHAQQILAWLAFALGPATVIFAGLFTILITRPIKQIDQAIRRLGDGEFSTEIHVTGPRDLEYLGQRLDWLRGRLDDLERQKIRFIRHVSHELKTPLTALREGAELLGEEVVGSLKGEQREIVEILRLNSIKLQKLIEDLLNFNLAETQSSISNAQAVQLDEVIKRVSKDHRITMVAKGLSLNADLPPTVVEGDEERLRIVVDNLLSNAIKYSPHGGTVNVSLKEEQQNAVLDVSDNGPGIHPDDAAKIFDAFYQGSTPPVDHNIKGTGLGLSITREYVQAHHGRIETLLDQPHGAHFRVTLPRQQIGPRHAA